MIRFIIALCLLPTLTLAGSLLPAGKIIWEHPLEKFGGLSGIEVYADGHFLVISDRGNFFTGWLQRENGEIISVSLDNHTPILDSKGNPLTGHNADSEGLAIGPNGDIYVSFEGNHRIMKHSAWDVEGTFLPKHPDFLTLQNNSSLEALAIDAEGRIYTIPERSGALGRPFPVYRFDGRWSIPFTIPRRGSMLVTGADFGPDGWLYVLERDFTWLGGFLTRVRRFMPDGDVLLEETLLKTRAGTLDNMEGISVWRATNGQIRVTLIADDNFNSFQNTVIAEYILEE